MSAIPYRPAIDGLRCIAVLSVFIFHLDPSWLPGGFVGVDVFFVISGFLITSIVYTDIQKGKFSLGAFYQRRIARLFPVFFVVALATLAVGSFVYTSHDFGTSAANFSAAVLSVANIKYILQGNYFTIGNDAQPFLHCWSLSVEEQFYIVFPLAFFLLCRWRRKAVLPVLGVVMGVSFVAGVLLSRSHPVWAFFLLPTRAWELMAGSVLAVWMNSRRIENGEGYGRFLPWIGLILLLISFGFIHETMMFPGWIAAIPVVGTLLILVSSEPKGILERMLGTEFLVKIGKISYSLYLWHWPVFCYVDYGLLALPEWLRLTLKISLSFVLALITFRFIEGAARIWLNQPSRRRLTFAGLAVLIGVFAVMGVNIRKSHYLNVESEDVAGGGIFIKQPSAVGSMVLIGDSNGSMYGTALREIMPDVRMDLSVLSVTGVNPLPNLDGSPNPLWIDILKATEKARPDVAVFVCNWTKRLEGRSEYPRLRKALDDLSPLAKRIVLITQPPALPSRAPRESIRKGHAPFFEEETAMKSSRSDVNQYVMSLASGNVEVLDVENLLHNTDGKIPFFDSDGHQIFHDAVHLSHNGAMLVMPKLIELIKK